MLKPDIWLAHHSEYFDLAGKRARVARQEEVGAWVNPDGYRRFVAGKKRAFDQEVDVELMARRRGDASARSGSISRISGSSSPRSAIWR